MSRREGLRSRLERLAARLPRPRRAPRGGDASVSPHRGDHPTLLEQVLAGSLEPDYEVVARRRAERQSDGAPGAAGSRRSPRRRAATMAVLAAFVLLLVAAGRQNREDQPADALVRETLVSTATDRRDELAQLQRDLAAARAENTALAARSSSAAQERASAIERLRRVGAASGFQSVTGPGLRMTLTDAPDDRGGELIRSDDLALLVDGLWEAGAEAISVNGERLSSRSAITTTNVSININRRPLTAPYTVSVIGDGRVLEAELAESQGGGAWLLLKQEFGFGFQTERVDELVLPAAPELLLRTCGACYPALSGEPSGQQPDR